jgi:hypothetical protein
MANEELEKIKDISKTIIKCKDYELLGDKNNTDPWILLLDNDIKVAVDAKEYVKFVENFKKLLKENFELRLEKAILSHFPIDYEDVKAVVLEELKNSNKSIEEVVDKVKIEHPNLFYTLDFENFF